jgi:hypothetical protein
VTERQRGQLDVQHGETWARELAQQHADDVVLAASLFKPNAGGTSGLSWAGLRARQVMKGRGIYLGERVVLAITPLDVYAVETLFGGRMHRTIRRWSRSDLFVSTVTTRGRPASPRWPALLVATREGRQLADVQALHHDDEAEHVGQLLLAGNFTRGNPGR